MLRKLLIIYPLKARRKPEQVGGLQGQVDERDQRQIQVVRNEQAKAEHQREQRRGHADEKTGEHPLNLAEVTKAGEQVAHQPRLVGALREA